MRERRRAARGRGIARARRVRDALHRRRHRRHRRLRRLPQQRPRELARVPAKPAVQQAPRPLPRARAPAHDGHVPGRPDEGPVRGGREPHLPPRLLVVLRGRRPLQHPQPAHGRERQDDAVCDARAERRGPAVPEEGLVAVEDLRRRRERRPGKRRGHGDLAEVPRRLRRERGRQPLRHPEEHHLQPDDGHVPHVRGLGTVRQGVGQLSGRELRPRDHAALQRGYGPPQPRRDARRGRGPGLRRGRRADHGARVHRLCVRAAAVQLRARPAAQPHRRHDDLSESARRLPEARPDRGVRRRRLPALRRFARAAGPGRVVRARPRRRRRRGGRGPEPRALRAPLRAERRRRVHVPRPRGFNGSRRGRGLRRADRLRRRVDAPPIRARGLQVRAAALRAPGLLRRRRDVDAGRPADLRRRGRAFLGPGRRRGRAGVRGRDVPRVDDGRDATRLVDEPREHGDGDARRRPRGRDEGDGGRASLRARGGASGGRDDGAPLRGRRGV
mmetsp:Transcript_15119/g.46698  ORF Transcript_15119/g.46698 Transcript_15119/m.46698 type:complete len:501 (+) Transcript_15119:2171-3673(+)